MVSQYHDGGAVIFRLQRTLRKRGKEASRPNLSQDDEFLLRRIVENLYPYVKIIQGIFVSRGVQDKHVDLFDLARELLDMKPGLDLESFKKDGLEGLSTDLKDMVTKVADACAAEGRNCGDFSEAKAIFINVENVSKKLKENYSMMFKDGETLPSLVEAKNFFGLAMDMRDAVNDLGEYLKKATNETMSASENTDLFAKMVTANGEYNSIKKTFKNKFSQESIASLSKTNLAQKFEAMKLLQIVDTDLDKIKYDVLITKFNNFKELILIFESKISDKKQWPLIEKRLRTMTALSNKSGLEINQKSFTRAFLNGFKDLTKLLQEIDSSFAEKIILKGGDPQQLKKALAPIDSLQSELKPIHEVLEKRNGIDAAEGKIKTWVEEVSVEVQDLKKVEPFHDCLPVLQNFNLTIDPNSWGTESTYIGALDDEAEKFAVGLNAISFELPIYEKLAVIFNDDTKTVKDIFKSIKNHSEFDKLLAELQTLYDSLNKLATKKLKQWVGQTNIKDLVQDAKNWLEKTEAGQTLQCLQNKELFESIRNIMSKQILLPAIQRMKPSDKAIKEIGNAESLLKEAFKHYGKLISIYHNRKTRAVDKQKKVDESIQITTDLAFALKLYMDVSSAYLLEEEIQKLLAFGQTIDDAIERLTDQDKKIRMKKMWNGKTKEALKSLPKVVEDFTKSIVSLPEKLEDYQKVFNVTSFDSLDGDINMKVFLEELRSMNSLLIDQPTAQKLETLDLSFSNARQKRLNGYQAFLLSMPVISSFQPPQKSIGDDNESKIGPGTWAAIFFGTVVILSFGSLFILWLINYRQTRKEKKGWWKAFKMIFPCLKKKSLDINVKNVVTIEPGEEEEDAKVEYYRTAEGKLLVKAKTNQFKENKPTAIKFSETEDGVAIVKIKKEEMDNGLTRISVADLKKNASKKELKVLEYLENTAIEYSKKENADLARLEQQQPVKNDLTICFKRRSLKDLKKLSKLKFKELPRCKDKPEISEDFVEYAVGREKDTFQTDGNAENVKTVDVSISDKHLKTAIVSEKNGKGTSKPSVVPDASTKTVISVARKVSTSSAKVQKTQESERATGGLDAVPTVNVGTKGLKIIPSLKKRWEIAFDILLKHELEKEDRIEYSDFTPEDYTNNYFERNELPRTNGKLNYLYIQKYMTSKTIVQYLGYRTGDAPHLILPVFNFKLAMEILQNAKEIFEKDPAILKLTREKLRVVGDIHGTYADMARHVELGLDDTLSSFLFLGDYVDRGPRSIDTLLYLCVLKMTNPNRFHFLRGNHELRSVNKGYGFLEECMKVYGKTNGYTFWKEANMFFDDLPVACIIGDRVWAAHGGISPLMLEGREFVEKNLVKRPTEDIQYKLSLDVLWSDPDSSVGSGAEIDQMFTVNDRLNVTSCFTRLGLDEVLKTCRFDFIIRGHQLKLFGHETWHSGKCITTYGGSNHLDENNLACQTIIHRNLKVEFIRFKNYGDECLADCEDTVDGENENDSSTTPNPNPNPPGSSSNVKTDISKKSKSSDGSSNSNASSKKSTSTASTSSDVGKKAVPKTNLKRPSCAPPDVTTLAKPSKSQPSAQPKAMPKEKGTPKK